MIFSKQRSADKHRFILVANQYINLINKPSSIPVYQMGALTELINALYESNLWEKFIAVYPFVGSNLEKHSLNLINPSKFKITWARPSNNSIVANDLGITGNGGTANTNIPLVTFIDFKNLHLSAYTRTSIFNTSGSGRLIGVNTRLLRTKLAIRDRGALEINFNKQTGIIGFVYNVLNDMGGYGMTYKSMEDQSVTGQGFFIANNNKEIKTAKCYLNGAQFGEQFPLLPTEIHPLNKETLTIFDGDTPGNPLRATISFLSAGYGLTDNEIFNFNKAVQSFQVAMNRSVL